MAARKKIAGENEKIQDVQGKFTKEQIVESEKFCGRRDLVDALLDAGKKYTMEQVDEMIQEYMKGQVR